MVRSILHLVAHVVTPGVVARLGWPSRWWRAWGIMLAATLIDLDHLLADPIYDPGRCSLGFHPLHSWLAASAYALMLVLPATRILGVGLLLHLALDGLDCLMT